MFLTFRPGALAYQLRIYDLRHALDPVSRWKPTIAQTRRWPLAPGAAVGSSAASVPAVAELAFTLIVRLPDGFGPLSDDWADWQRSREVLGERAFAEPHTEAPFKRYPGSEHRRYFAAHVERVLFPPADAASGRRSIRLPDQALLLGAEDRPEFTLAIDLLEIVCVGLAPHHTYGLIHLSAADELEPDAVVRCASALGERYRRSDVDRPFLAIAGPEAREPLEGNWTLRALASALFGAAHPFAGDRSMICSIARVPDALPAGAVDLWRRALGQGDSLEEAEAKLARNPDRDERRRVELGEVTGVIFGRAAVFTHGGDSRSYLRNVRSYWCEALLFAHIQHSYLEVYADRLAELGADPLGTDVAALFEDWLAFRNTLWWSHLSPVTDVPQKLLPRARAELGTQALFDELEQSFATYVEQRQRRSEDRLANALAALQVYGAVFAAVGTVAAALQVVGDGLFDCWLARVAVIVGLLLIAVTVYYLIRRRVDRA